MKSKQPDRRALKAGILWCARWLLSQGEFYRGRIQVDISYGRERDSIVVRPTREVSGLTIPSGMEGMEPGCGDSPAPLPPVDVLLRMFLSPDERRILRSLASRQPSTAQDVCDEVRITRSTFFALWGNLQQRGIVDENDAGKFELAGACAWLRDVREGIKPAA